MDDIAIIKVRHSGAGAVPISPRLKGADWWIRASALFLTWYDIINNPNLIQSDVDLRNNGVLQRLTISITTT